MSINKHQIFASNDLKEKFVDMPEWGGQVKIRALSVKEQLAYDEYLSTEPKEVEMALHLIISACVDDDNKKLFDISDMDLLKEKSSKNLFLLVNEILSLNKQLPADSDKLAKNL
jgi:hypothetical protein